MLGVKVGSSGPVSLELGGPASLGDEGYQLTVTPASVRVVANAPAGLFHGVQTLRQLLPAKGPQRIPAVSIRDRPRFAWRGAMLDVARHFRSVRDVKRFVDLMALYKLNRLHLHLSDDQGWRIAISKWPRLATHGGATAVGGGKGGYYTQAQYSDIVRYAAARYVVVVPEIDMPGHVHAALSSYPKLACDGKPSPLYTGIERRLQLALHRQDDHVRLRLGRRRRARTADARPVDPHRRRRGLGDEAPPTTSASSGGCRRSSRRTAST